MCVCVSVWYSFQRLMAEFTFFKSRARVGSFCRHSFYNVSLLLFILIENTESQNPFYTLKFNPIEIRSLALSPSRCYCSSATPFRLVFDIVFYCVYEIDSLCMRAAFLSECVV